MRLSVIIVSYNVKYYLDQCLFSVRRALRGIDAEVIVFDNHSRDGSVEYLSRLYPEVRFISSNHNLGFAKGNNRAILQGRGKYVLLLNPDTVVAEDTLRQALDFMECHPKVGATGVRMMKVDGGDAMESRRGVPSPMTSFCKMTGLCVRFPHSRRLGRYYMGWLPWDRPVRMEIVSGAFCMLRREALDEVGLLDEDFFMYGEDIDLSYRLLKGGWENWYLPLRILHYKGESTQKSSFRYVHVFYEAMLIFFRKHYRHLGLLVAAPIQLAIYAKASMAFVSMALGMCRKGLGFVGKRSVDEVFYSFYVKAENVERCKAFVRANGLRAEIHEAEKGAGKVLEASCAVSRTYMVYDISAYAFADMLCDFSCNANGNLFLATYFPERGMVVTDKDVIVCQESLFPIK